MINTLQQQIIASLITSPDNYGRRAMASLEPEDFPHPHYALIFKTLAGLKFPNHPEPGSILIQLNTALMKDGHFKNSDDGLRARINDLTGITGHPQQLPDFTTELINHRWRQAVIAYAENITEHATKSPDGDVAASLAGIEELRRLYTRVTSGGAA